MSKLYRTISQFIFPVALLGLMFSLPGLAAADPHFETVEQSKCDGPGNREWSARIVDIPWGQSWEITCAQTQAPGWGYPHHCVNVLSVSEYGVWLRPDAACNVGVPTCPNPPCCPPHYSPRCGVACYPDNVPCK